jgi:hypothetical protein
VQEAMRQVPDEVLDERPQLKILTATI